jgi:hypothetical protein
LLSLPEAGQFVRLCGMIDHGEEILYCLGIYITYQLCLLKDLLACRGVKTGQAREVRQAASSGGRNFEHTPSACSSPGTIPVVICRIMTQGRTCLSVSEMVSAVVSHLNAFTVTCLAVSMYMLMHPHQKSNALQPKLITPRLPSSPSPQPPSPTNFPQPLSHL